jgi:hypothetical protein
VRSECQAKLGARDAVEHGYEYEHEHEYEYEHEHEYEYEYEYGYGYEYEGRVTQSPQQSAARHHSA